jgi:chemotaxis response regulator CheB
VRTILVDDGSWLRQHLCDRLERHPEIVVVGEADEVQSAAELVAVTQLEGAFFF